MTDDVAVKMWDQTKIKAALRIERLTPTPFDRVWYSVDWVVRNRARNIHGGITQCIDRSRGM